MPLFSAASIKKLLQQYGIKPLKSLGQHFLIDQNIIKKIVDSASLSPQDTIIEIGPGLGTLTLELASRVKKVVAIEKDKKISEILKNILNTAKINNVEIVHQDFLKVSDSFLPTTGYKVIANLPYYVTSPIIKKLLEISQPPQQITFLVQKEVAQRICAKPPKMSMLSISVQYYAEPIIVFYVSKNSFWPIPKVDSAIIQLNLKLSQPEKTDNQLFFRVVKAGFSAPRKQLANNLSASLNIDRVKMETILKNCHLDPKQRAETLTVKDWRKLTLILFNPQ